MAAINKHILFFLHGMGDHDVDWHQEGLAALKASFREYELLRRFTSMDDRALFLYARGMMTREIVSTFKEIYDADASAGFISKVTDAALEVVIEGQSRPLDAVYPIAYLDCIVVKTQQDRKVIANTVYLALGVNMEGHKELLNLWL